MFSSCVDMIAIVLCIYIYGPGGGVERNFSMDLAKFALLHIDTSGGDRRGCRVQLGENMMSDSVAR